MTMFCVLYILRSRRLKIQQRLILQEGLTRRDSVDFTPVELSGAACVWQLVRSAVCMVGTDLEHACCP